MCWCVKGGMSSRAVRFLSQAFDWVTRRPIERAGLAMVLASFFSVPLYLVSKPFGSIIALARTGGPFPGEQSCGTSECHNTTSNSGPGSVSIDVDGVPISAYLYTPGETVEMTVRVQDPAQQRWGFQITVRDADDGCMSVGSFFGRPADTIVRTEGAGSGCAAGREFATHDVAKLGGSSGVFTFDWMAPVADVGPIIFAAAGNAADGNNARTGDLIYTTSESVDAVAAPPPPPDPVVPAGGVVLSTLVPSVPRFRGSRSSRYSVRASALSRFASLILTKQVALIRFLGARAWRSTNGAHRSSGSFRHKRTFRLRHLRA